VQSRTAVGDQSGPRPLIAADRAPHVQLHLHELAGPPATYRTIVELIGATTTTKALRIKAERDTEWYPVGVKIGDAEMAAFPSPATNGTATGTTRSTRR